MKAFDKSINIAPTVKSLLGLPVLNHSNEDRLRAVSLAVGYNKNQYHFLEEWTYLIFNNLFVYLGESVQYAYGAKIFLYCLNRFTFV